MFVERGKYNMRIKEEFNNSIEVIEKGMFSKWINEEWLRKKMKIIMVALLETNLKKEWELEKTH